MTLTPCPIKQPHPSLLLQRTNMLTHGRLAQMQHLRRLAKAHLLRHRPKHPQPKVLQSPHLASPSEPPPPPISISPPDKIKSSVAPIDEPNPPLEPLEDPVVPEPVNPRRSLFAFLPPSPSHSAYSA